jgi:hypothetical protein
MFAIQTALNLRTTAAEYRLPGGAWVKLLPLEHLT